MSVTLGELERRLWDAANAVRGPVDPADFTTCAFPMPFWKWISDTHDWERGQPVAEYGEDVPTEAEADCHRFTVPAGTHWREVTTRTDNLGTPRLVRRQGQFTRRHPLREGR